MSSKVADSFVNEETALFLRRDGWQNWTPVITQTGNVTFTLNYARYIVIAQTVSIVTHLTVTGAGGAASGIIISGIPTAIQPVNAVLAGTAFNVIGNGIIYDSSAGIAYHGALVVVSTASDWRLRAHNTAGYIGGVPAITLASGDIISFQCTYER